MCNSCLDPRRFRTWWDQMCLVTHDDFLLQISLFNACLLLDVFFFFFCFYHCCLRLVKVFVLQFPLNYQNSFIVSTRKPQKPGIPKPPETRGNHYNSLQNFKNPIQQPFKHRTDWRWLYLSQWCVHNPPFGLSTLSASFHYISVSMNSTDKLPLRHIILYN